MSSHAVNLYGNNIIIAILVVLVRVRHSTILLISNIATLQSRYCYSHFADEETDLERISDLLKTTLVSA